MGAARPETPSGAGGGRLQPLRGQPLATLAALGVPRCSDAPSAPPGYKLVPVVRRRIAHGRSPVARPWQLLGVHSTRIDMFSTDRMQAEAPGLHCPWYVEVLMKLTAER